ncbi:PEP-CTERM sorting domain-containing protein [Prosthecobacter sp.]|uniref:PEP-CTERM sorting domain-containing protein n=1 Tax=Prosthecobacter sp. TaxID=1965333 RepID=UPI0037830A37
MMFNPKKAITLLAAAGMAFASTAVNAATTYTAGDLLLGFRQTGTGASTNSLVIDIGQASLYRDATGTLNPVLGTAGLDADLAAQFGPNWYTDGSVKWAIVGTTGAAAVGGDPSNTLYSSLKQTSGLNTAGYEQLDNGTQATATTGINNLATTYAGKTITDNVALIQSNTTAGTWGKSGTGVGSDFGYSGVWGTSLEQAVSATSKLDLSRAVADNINGGGTFGSIEGTFSISSTGGISFTSNVAAAPEPGRAAFMALGLSAFMLRRRRPARVAA